MADIKKVYQYIYENYDIGNLMFSSVYPPLGPIEMKEIKKAFGNKDYEAIHDFCERKGLIKSGDITDWILRIRDGSMVLSLIHVMLRYQAGYLYGKKEAHRLDELIKAIKPYQKNFDYDWIFNKDKDGGEFKRKFESRMY